MKELQQFHRTQGSPSLLEHRYKGIKIKLRTQSKTGSCH